MATHDVELADDVPERIKEVFEHFGGFFIPDETNKEIKDIYRQVLRGRCMTCNSKLGDTTHITINPLGITEAYCCMQCHQDMMVMGWISIEYDHIKEAVEFRGRARTRHD